MLQKNLNSYLNPSNHNIIKSQYFASIAQSLCTHCSVLVYTYHTHSYFKPGDFNLCIKREKTYNILVILII